MVFRPTYWLAVSVGALLFVATAAASTVDLGRYDVDPRQTTVSGVSSGGFMAVQLHLAYSSLIQGAGVLAGGPYGCAQGSLARASRVCLGGQADSDSAIGRTEAAFANGAIDDPANLADDRAWLFSGYNDGVVRQPTMDALAAYYRHWLGSGDVYYRDNLGAGHAHVTDDFGGTCAETGDDFINDCDLDSAGALLQFLYGRLSETTTDALQGRLVAFDQRPFLPDAPARASMAATGYLYLPWACADGARCRVHVALHGCGQGVEAIGDAFYRHAGYNEWADGNRIIVLYPQAVSSRFAPVNPKGCWDWWGYTGADYATRDGVQMQAVRAMLARLSGGQSDDVADGGPTTGSEPPSDLAVVDVADDAVQLAWSGNTAADGFMVYRADGGEETFASITPEPVTGTAFADGPLQPATSYRYRVAAVHEGNETAPAGPVDASTGRPAPPCDPYFSDNVSHTMAGRAYAWLGLTFANGSNEPMGLWTIHSLTGLYRDGANRYRVGVCPPASDH